MDAAPPAPPSAWAVAKEARALLRSRQYDAAIAKYKAALTQAPGEGIGGEDLGLLYYLHGYALSLADRDEEAIQSLRRAVELAPKDADARLELAQVQLRSDEPEEAKTQAQAALALGLSEKDDRQAAEQVVKKAKSEILHARFSFVGSASFGFDSNVLQGASRETIAGQNTGASAAKLRKLPTVEDKREQLMLINQLFTNYQGAVQNAYQAAPKVESASEYDLPISVFLDLGGRPVGTKTFELWLGYRFSQTFMLSPGKTPALNADGTTQVSSDGSVIYDRDHDSYSTQEHTAYVRGQWSPRSWLMLRPKVEGFANFTGLSTFSPFQGGMLAGLEAMFTESPRWRTRLTYQHQLRRSFDSVSSGYLDADRDEVKLLQELRLRGQSVRARGTLSYRFRSDRAGEVTSTVPYSTLLTYFAQARVGGTGAQVAFNSDLGNFSYFAPLTYLSHELATRWRLTLPHAIDLVAGFAYENRSYPTPYRTTYSSDVVKDQNAISSSAKIDKTRIVAALCTPAEILSKSQSCTGVLPASNFSVDSEQRKDHLISADVSIGKDLPAGFSLELGYGFMRNFSSIASLLDNRSYTKHTVVLSAMYAF